MSHSAYPNIDRRVLDAIAQQTSANTAWLNVFDHIGDVAVFEILTGAIGTSLDIKLTQAKDSSGTGAKDITGAVIPQLTTASGNDSCHTIEINPAALDEKNGYTHVRCEVTAVGTCVWGVKLEYHRLRFAGQTTRHSSYGYAIQVLT